MKRLMFFVLFQFIALIFLVAAWTKPAFAQQLSCVDACVQDTGQDRASCISDCKAGGSPYDFGGAYWDVTVPKLGTQLNKCESKPGEVDMGCWFFTALSTLTSGQGIANLGNPVATAMNGSNSTSGAARPGGAAGFIASGIDMMIENKPASSVDYVAYMGKQLRVPGTPEVAYAAGGGLGFNGLTPVLNIWVLMRNLAYFVFAVMFVVIGVMIMTRRKIDPKTAASIQNALPKIIFALIIVSFSYAIAGFLVDLMYVALALIVTIMGSLPGGSGQAVDNLLSGSIFGFVLNGDKGLFGVSGSIAVITSGIVNNMLGIQNIPIVSNAVGAIGGGLAFLIVSIAILVALFRTWLALLGAFANIILAVIFAPLRLTLDAMPGQNQFMAWVKDLLANLLTFPLVTILLSIGAYIASYSTPPEVVGFTPPLLGAGNVREVLPFIGLGILLTIPKSLDILREVLKAPPNKFGGAWMENVRAVQPVAKYGYETGRWVANTGPVSRATEPIRGEIDARVNTVREKFGSLFPKRN